MQSVDRSSSRIQAEGPDNARLHHGDAKIIVNVRYFAQIREAVGTTSEQFVLAKPITIEDLLLDLMKRYPQLAQMKDVFQIALNRRIIQEGLELKHGDEIALLPPVMGG